MCQEFRKTGSRLRSLHGDSSSRVSAVGREPSRMLIGRQDELQQLCQWLERPEARLLTVVGSGGIGKTRLAQELERLWSHALVWVELEDVADGENAILGRLGQTLELPECSSEEWHTRLDTLLSRPTLIVFDNLEHLRARAHQISTLLELHPRLRVVNTSRAPTLLQGEQLLPLGPLELEAATALFTRRALEVRPDFEADQGLEDLCRRLDCIPLCLELAAARVRHLGLNEISQSLAHSLEFLSGGGPDRPARQQTLNNTLDWSYGLLSAEQQATFARLSVFRGGFTTAALEAVGGQLAALFELVDHSLVVMQPGPESRFTLLETVRTYANQKLKESESQEQPALQHARFFLKVAENMQSLRGSPRHAEALQRLAAEKSNLARALETFEQQQHWDEALALAANLGWYWEACSLLDEGRQWLARLLEREPSSVSGTHANRAWEFLGTLSRHQGDYGAAERAYLRASDSPEVQCGLGQLRFREGRYEQARQHFEQAGDNEVEALNGLGLVAWAEGKLDQALQLEQQSLQLAARQASGLGQAWAHNSLGEVHRSRQDWAEATHHFRAAAEGFRQLHEFSLAALALQNLAYVELGQNRWEEAERSFREALKLWRQAGARHGLALCLVGLAGVLSGREQSELAARLLGVADRMLESIGVRLEASDQQDYRKIEARLRNQLKQEFSRLRVEGGQLDDLLARLDEQPVPELTARELEVLRVTATGASNKEIAEELSISPQTVMVHLRSVYRKLNVTSRTAAARWAAEQGLLP